MIRISAFNPTGNKSARHIYMVNWTTLMGRQCMLIAEMPMRVLIDFDVRKHIRNQWKEARFNLAKQIKTPPKKNIEIARG